MSNGKTVFTTSIIRFETIGDYAIWFAKDVGPVKVAGFDAHHGELGPSLDDKYSPSHKSFF